MFEYSSFTSIVGTDGTTTTLNGASGLVLEDCSGFDSPNVRQNIEDLPEADGAIAGPFFLGQRPVTLSGRIINLDPATRNQQIVNLQRSLRGLGGEVTLYASPTGLPAMRTSGRLAGLRITGQFVKQVQIQLVCADPRLYSQALNASTLTQSGTPSAPGASFPWAFPVNWGGGGGAYSVAINVTNAGNFPTPCLLRAAGPIASPQFTDASSGLSIYVDGVTLASGEYLEVDTGARTIVKSDGTNLYGYARFPGTSWFQLDPGSSAIQLWGTGTTAATALTVTWRDAWA